MTPLIDAFIGGLLAGGLAMWTFCRRALLLRAMRVLGGHPDDRVDWRAGYRELKELESGEMPLVGMSQFIGLGLFAGMSVAYAIHLLTDHRPFLAYVVGCLPAAAFLAFGFWRLAAFSGPRTPQ